MSSFEACGGGGGSAFPAFIHPANPIFPSTHIRGDRASTEIISPDDREMETLRRKFQGESVLRAAV